jgi:hypothetical protein
MTADFVEIYRKPTRQECHRSGWHRGHLVADILQEFERVRSAASWIKENIDGNDYRLFPEGLVYFKYEYDLIVFKLKWY